jgi:hypothetical protein
MPGIALYLFIAFFALAGIGGMFYAGWYAYRLFKSGMRIADRFQKTADAMAPQLATLERNQTTFAESQARLSASIASLQASLARFAVVVGLIGEALAPVGWLRSLFRR